MNEQLAKYLKSKKGLNRLLIELKNKYISLNRYSGSVKILNITKEESIDISNLLGRKVEENSTLKTSFSEITKKIEQGKYKGFNYDELFKYYFGNNIESKYNKRVKSNIDKEEYFNNFIKENSNNKNIKYIEDIINSKNDIYIILKKQYKKDKIELKKELSNILKLLDNIPKESISLPIYSSITGNPHYLDFNTKTSNLFFKILSYIKGVEYSSKVQDKINLLMSINVYVDPASNFVITYNLTGNYILDKLSKNNQIVNLNLLNINYLDNIDTKIKKVFIFENPSIMHSLLNLNIPIVVTSGMPNLSFYKLIDKLVKSGNELYYNGDFDPEGLLIANLLKEKYPNLNLFCYDKEDYNNSKSDEIINISRLKKLNNIDKSELNMIKNVLLNNKYSAYQEKNINRILQYIRETIK